MPEQGVGRGKITSNGYGCVLILYVIGCEERKNKHRKYHFHLKQKGSRSAAIKIEVPAIKIWPNWRVNPDLNEINKKIQKRPSMAIF